MATQKIALSVNDDQYGSFSEGSQLSPEQMSILGIDEGTNHLKIEFDNENSAKYCLCRAFAYFSMTVYGFPIFLLTVCHPSSNPTPSNVAIYYRKKPFVRLFLFSFRACIITPKNGLHRELLR